MIVCHFNYGFSSIHIAQVQAQWDPYYESASLSILVEDSQTVNFQGNKFYFI